MFNPTIEGHNRNMKFLKHGHIIELWKKRESISSIKQRDVLSKMSLRKLKCRPVRKFQNTFLRCPSHSALHKKKEQLGSH